MVNEKNLKSRLRGLFCVFQKDMKYGKMNANFRRKNMIHLLLVIIYLSFISLGLPDSLLGAAWPVMYRQFQVPISYAGIISMIIALGTVISSLQSDRLTLRFGTGKITAVSVAMTATALFGFSVSTEFWMLIIWAIPYGLGAGSVDASLNNYVALHYESRHMSWLHCMWGVGATVGPYIMGYALTADQNWNNGYRYIAVMQVVLTIVLFLSLPMWKGRKREQTLESKSDQSLAREKDHPSELKQNHLPAGKPKSLGLLDVLRISGAKQIMICFFCYCGIEQAAGLWGSSYLNLHNGIPKEQAASFGALFFIGITVGRAISGFVTLKLSDTQMIRCGFGIIFTGIVVMLLPGGNIMSIIGLITVGLGCAPIYPCVIHSTPTHFGEEKSQAVIGVQMACAYIGTLSMPPVFGLVARYLSIACLPAFLLVLLIFMMIMYEWLIRGKKHGKTKTS